MPKKTKIVSRKSKKTARKKINFSRLLLIFFAVIMLLSFMLFSVFNTKSHKPEFRQSSSNSKSAPSFRKDGTVSIITEKSTINISVEVAEDEEERMQGLMYRYSMNENEGMLFIFPNEEPRSFWMKNTLISLDIIYINSRKEIVSIQKYTQPRSTYSLPSEKPAMYVLEVNAGVSDKFGINPEDKIQFTY